ncbi:MAG: glycerol-3-phosphate 1-O-acyltransferase PlsY [Candidatus Hydrogenedentes bacterium]|nr:glycerol-3-phosphate 1-O-acyltransferase PlsY [Candidatus Hydrogenedentota bacterium]
MAWTTLAVALSYLIGSVPTGLLLGLWLRGVDIREHGSKNIGATNTMRVLGKKLGALALAGDAGKGLVATLAVARLSAWPYAALICGLAAILGHTCSAFLKFKGGKGVATSTGVFLALCPLPTLIAAAVFFTVAACTRMVSAGSISAAAALTVAIFLIPHAGATWPAHLLPDDAVLRTVVALVALLVVVKHRANIQRILKGEENRL